MAARKQTRHGATARTGGTQGRKTAARRVPAKPSRTSPPATSSRKPTAKTRRKSLFARIGWKYLPIGILGLALLLGWTLYPVARLQYRQQKDNAKLERQLADIRKRNSELRSAVDRLKKPEGIEEAARERLGFAKRGEQVWVVTTEGVSPESSAANAAVIRTSGMNGETGLWERALDAVFGVGR
jgi:cell division protein FtsB